MKPEQISKLIEALKINDEKRADEYEEEPDEPREAMDALVKVGKLAVEPLLELLKDTSKYSCLYAIKVLGEIRDPRAVQPIIEAFSSEDFREVFVETGDYDEPNFALQKIGLPALEPVLNYLEEKKKKADVEGMVFSLSVLAHFKDEKAFRALVNMLSYSDDEVQYFAIESLREYGDKRAVEYLKKLLGKIDAKDIDAEDLLINVGKSAIDAIRKLAPTREYRNIIAPYALEYLKRSREEINKYLRHIESTHEYPLRFEGDDAEDLNAVAQEYKIGESMQNLLRRAAELAVYEAVISDDEYKQLETIFWKLFENQLEFKREHEEEIDIIKGYIPGPVLKEKKRSYKGLAPESTFAEHPKLDTLRTRIWERLKKQEFRVFRKHSNLFARKGAKNARKGCYVAVVKDDERPRTWGLVHLILWGEGWTEEEVEKFTEPFWQHVDRVVIELVGEKKFALMNSKGNS